MKKNEKQRLFDPKLCKYEDILVEFHRDIGKSKRVNEKFVIIGTYLYLHGKLTQSNLVDLTGFSSGTISTYLAVMEGMGLITKQRIPKTHTFEYGITIPITNEITERLNTSLKSFITIQSFLIKKKEQLEELKKKSKSGAKHLSKRIKQLIDALEYYKDIYITLEKDVI